MAAVMFMEKKLIFRLLMVPLLLMSFYMLGWPLETIGLLGVVFVLIILFRGKLWKASESAIERYMPFTKGWKAWQRKLLVVLLFFAMYAVAKQAAFFALGLAGVDVQQMAMDAYNNRP